MTVRLGVFVVPDATDVEATLGQIVAADEAGLDLVGVQDHPYQRRFFDTWTQLAFAAAQTSRIRLVPDVLNLPLRSPVMVAKAAASLDLLSGGRLDVGLGAGAFWDRIAGMGGPRRTPGQSVDALVEAISILRAFWSGDGKVSFEGEHYSVPATDPGPLPLHPLGIWLGAYKPRMLRITGGLADGWLPSLGGKYFTADDVPAAQAAIDSAARAAGRDPSDVVRAANVMGLDRSVEAMADALARMVSELGFSTLIVGIPSGQDPVAFVRRLGEEVAPRVRALTG
jgi:alkanesulfonate monooxygenase SsuD/methylene tetrahydromethanopterin reductase-like flavin-dependent oxidoreductase (luciferase family)